MCIKFIEKSDSEEIEIVYHKKDRDVMIQLKAMLGNFVHRLHVQDEHKRMCVLPIMYIYYFESVDGKCYVYTKDETFLAFQSYRQLQQRLSHHGFLQCSKTMSMNTLHLWKCEIYSDCRRIITLNNHERLIVSRAFKKHFDVYLRKQNM
ncbi:MAG: LytTR family transcriptional regulator DNA-binding domain-containing protein [Erysipelotrichaceae bacterium]|nr:LytTR family transcriptional regulator DNA-binding domain-containing protein [Erysipelotrichaceae bacterium]